MYILGLNAFHADSSACLFKDENLIAAAEERDFVELNIGLDFQVKRSAGAYLGGHRVK